MTASYLAYRTEAAFDRADRCGDWPITTPLQSSSPGPYWTANASGCGRTLVRVVGSAANALYFVVVPLRETVTFVTYQRLCNR
jgi:hypothetical protein